jgi:amidase
MAWIAGISFDRRGGGSGVAGGSRVLAAPPTTTAKLGNGGILDAGVWEQQQMMEAGKLTSHSLTSQYLARIKTIDKSGPRLNAIIEINPEALKIALDMDRERKLRRCAVRCTAFRFCSRIISPPPTA